MVPFALLNVKPVSTGVDQSRSREGLVLRGLQSSDLHAMVMSIGSRCSKSDQTEVCCVIRVRILCNVSEERSFFLIHHLLSFCMSLRVPRPLIASKEYSLAITLSI